MKLPRLLGIEMTRGPLLVVAVLLLLIVGWSASGAEARDDGTPPTQAWTGRWSDEVLDLAATVPVQSQGRVKPLHTWANFALLGTNGRRSCKTADGETISAMEWWLDAAFRPKVGRTHLSILIQDSEVLDALDLGEVSKKKRDRYSYDELVPDAKTRDKLRELAGRFHAVDEKQRSAVEDGIVNLESTVSLFEGISRLFAVLRIEPQVDGSDTLKKVFQGEKRVRFTDLLAKAPELVGFLQTQGGGGDPHAGHDHGEGGPKLSADAQAVADILSAAYEATEDGLMMGMLPPTGTVDQEPQWFAIHDVVGFATLRGMIDPAHLEAMRALESMVGSVGSQPQFLESLKEYHKRVQSMADARGEYGKIEQEVALYELDPFGKSLVLYLIAFALLAVTWLRPQWRWLEILAWTLLWGTLALHTYGVVQRCLIRERPPISTLYDTVVFITGAGVLSMMLIELMNRRKVALAITPIVGWLGLFIASRYEVLKGTDTMPQLPAVLDTNFWLALHVTCISIGYCAGLLAAIIAHVYVLGKVFRFKSNDQAFYRNVGKMTYGVLCFALLFALVGTILGGIWANDSWGRFWGWDPKENGALLICIAQLAILHGRMGGLFKTFGVCQGAILGGTVVAFSWWHVNHLGVGLHSYGFTSGIIRGLAIFYGVEAAVMLAGLYAWMRDRPRVVTA